MKQVSILAFCSLLLHPTEGEADNKDWKEEKNNTPLEGDVISLPKSLLELQSRPENQGLDLPLDPFTLHHPFLKSNLREFQFSEWYYLFFVPDNESLSLSSASFNSTSVTAEVVKSLSSKLSVPASVFLVSKVEILSSGSLSTNLSLTKHTIPQLHFHLCHLKDVAPKFRVQGVNFRLVNLVHDKNQHLYIRNNQSIPSGGDQLGLLLTLILGGMGMFMMVMVFGFMVIQVVSKHQDLLKVGEMEDILMENPEDSIDTDTNEREESAKDIFIIDDANASDEVLIEVGDLARKKREHCEEYKMRNFPREKLADTLQSGWGVYWDRRLIDLD